MRYLVVEDDNSSRILLERMLSPYGTPLSVSSGREALEVFEISIKQGIYFDLICLDIMMPEMDGHEVLHKIREIENNIGLSLASSVKIVMTTALADVPNVMQAIRNKCNGYLIKPIDRKMLVEKLKSLNLIN